ERHLAGTLLRPRPQHPRRRDEMDLRRGRGPGQDSALREADFRQGKRGPWTGWRMRSFMSFMTAIPLRQGSGTSGCGLPAQGVTALLTQRIVRIGHSTETVEGI